VLGELLRLKMEQRGISQTQAASELGVPQSVLSRWLGGQMRPSTEKCIAIAIFLGMSTEEVLRLAGHLPEEEPRNGRRQRIDPRLELVRSQVVAMRSELDKLLTLVSAMTTAAERKHPFPWNSYTFLRNPHAWAAPA